MITMIQKMMPKAMRIMLENVYVRMERWKEMLKTQGRILSAKLQPAKAIYYCPCCNHRFRSFITVSFTDRLDFYYAERYQGIQQEIECPICKSIPRHRILAEWLGEHKEELKNKEILYFAVESGIRRWLKKNKIQVKTADLYTQADLKIDIENTMLPDSSWDFIVCNHVLEHVFDYKKALSELYRILKPGGTLIISFPILASLPTLIEETEHTEENIKKRLQLYGQKDHLRIFGTDSKEMLVGAGFEVAMIEGEGMPTEILPVVGPADYDVNYLFECKKPIVVMNGK